MDRTIIPRIVPTQLRASLSSSLLQYRHSLLRRTIPLYPFLSSRLIGVILCVCPSVASWAQISESAAIKYVQEISVTTIDSGYVSSDFQTWLKKTIGKNARITWELNDCGEQTGNPAIDRERNIPYCVGAYAELPDGRRVGVLILVNTQTKGKLGKPSFYDAYVEAGGAHRTARRLRELADMLKREKGK